MRFSVFVFPLLVLIIALSSWMLSSVGMIAANQMIDRFPPSLLLAVWCLEALGLLGLFLLIERRSPHWWVDGLLAGWLAWIFRGPLLVVMMVVVAKQSQSVWWTMVFSWWLTYSFCGVSLGAMRRLFYSEPEAVGPEAVEQEAVERETVE